MCKYLLLVLQWRFVLLKAINIQHSLENYLLFCQIFLIINGFYRGFDLYFSGLMVFLMQIFLYDEYVFLKALRSYSCFEYELLDPLVCGDAAGAVKISVDTLTKETDGKTEVVDTN